MPLFPIASEDSKDGHAFGQEVSPSKEAARTSMSKDKRPAWLQVGRSYQGVEVWSDEGPKGFKQGGKAQQESVLDATSSAGIIKRPKASDFFGVPVDDQIADVQVDDAENSIISKRRHSYPSDDDHNGGKANSDAGVREGRIKTGYEGSTSSDESHRRHKGKHKEREGHKKKAKRARTSSKSRRKSNHREGVRRYTSKSRRYIDSNGSESDSNSSSDSSKRDRGEPKSKLFVEDRWGDKDNLSFGGFYRMDVPIYHNNKANRKERVRRSGGSGDNVRYFSKQARRSSEGIARVQLWRGDKRRHHMAAAASQASASAVGTDTDIETDGQHQLHTSGWDFLPLDPTVARLTPQKDFKEKVNADDDFDVPSESIEEWVTRKTKDFNLLTRQHPDSEDVWLRFADFQEEAVHALQGGESLRSSSGAGTVSRTSLEKRASVLEGALRQNPSSIRLRIAQLHIASQMHEHDAVDSLWRGAIKKSNNSVNLWLGYLHFKSGHFASFSMEKQRHAFSRCIEVLRCRRLERIQEREKEDKGGGASMLQDCREHVRDENDLLDVLWSYCLMERSAGYHERALGALQAMVELNITPRDSPVSLDDLEAFWESETARVGDAHPSLAGISMWRKAISAKARNDLGGDDSREGDLKPGGKRAAIAITRKLPMVRALDARGRRKRAVDFFSDTVTSVKGNDPSSPNQSRHGSDAMEVLEKAYHAAEALSNKTAAENHSAASTFPSLDKSHSKNDEKDKRDAPIYSSKESSSMESMLWPKSNTIDPPITSKIRQQQSNQHDIEGMTNPDGHGRDDVRGVEAEGLIWVDDSQTTAYSVRHGYRINVQEAQDSVSGLEYGRILNQVRGDTKDDRGVDAVTAAARERKRKEEMAKQEAVVELEDVPANDPFSSWAKTEDDLTRHQWQPLRATTDEEGAQEQPDRVVFVEDVRPFLFNLSQPASLRKLVQMLVSIGGMVFPRSNVSHSYNLLAGANCAASLGDGGLLSAINDGLQAVWGASEAELPVSGRGVVRCTGRSGSHLPALAVTTAADQFLLLTDELVGDVYRQKFLRNVLHHLIRAPHDVGDDVLVQLQCALMLFEGYLSMTSSAGGCSVDSRSSPGTSPGKRGNESYGHEARKVAKSLLEASQASATDLRLWSSYVQLLAILGDREEAIKVAKKALSLVQALPEMKKSLAAEMFWVTFRLHAGLPLTPRDPHVGEDGPPHYDAALSSLFGRNEKSNAHSEMALLLLCSFAEGRFDRPKKIRKTNTKSVGKGSHDAAVSPLRLMAARRVMADRVARLAADLPQEGATNDISSVPQGGLDMTPSAFMYHSIAWVWLEYLTRGPDKAEHAMAECLTMVKLKSRKSGNNDSHLRGSMIGHTRYSWGVVCAGTVHGVCLERMHRAFSELMVLAQHYDPAATGPRRIRGIPNSHLRTRVGLILSVLKVRLVLLRGLRSFPAEPGMLCMLLATEQFSGSRQRVVHHLSEVSCRRALDWEQGPTSFEWIMITTHQVMRCVHEVRQTLLAPKAGREGTKAVGERRGDDRALSVKEWLPGSYARLKRSMEHAVTHPTGRQIPMLWRIYMALEAMRGNHKQARQLFWRAIHSCPGNKSVWMDALRGDQREQMGSMGLRPAFRGKELQEISEALFEKSLHLRAEPP